MRSLVAIIPSDAGGGCEDFGVAAQKSERNFSRLTMMLGDKIVGVVTETDIVKALEKCSWVAQ